MRTVFSILCLAFLFSQCMRDGTTPHSTASGQETILQAKQSATLRTNSSASEELSIRVDTIQDSRCPKTVTCVWAGNAQVSFTAAKEKVSQAGKLCIGACAHGFKTADTTHIQLSGVSYDVILQGVDPYPGNEGNQEPKKARILIRSR